jgi:hypothetical protein
MNTKPPDQRSTPLGTAWHLGLALALALPAAAQVAPFTLPRSGCPMAHCDARMSDQVRTLVPSVGHLVRRDPARSGGDNFGLGCSSNQHLVACSLRGDPAEHPNLVVFDGDGRRIWDDGGRLGEEAWMSIPLVGKDDTVIAADRHQVLRAEPLTGRILWISSKPDPGHPISPIPAGTDDSLLFIATAPSGEGEAAMSVWDHATGALLSYMPLVDVTTGQRYVTRNTPAARGNRVYVLAESETDPTDGRLVAIDLCNSVECGGRGRMVIRWSYSFKGPSGSSPLVVGTRIYFDGRPTQGKGRVHALVDQGVRARLLWQRDFSSILIFSATHDPRGGLWVAPATAAQTLLRLNADTGQTDQQVMLSEVLALEPGYSANSVLSIYESAERQPVLMVAVGRPDAPTFPDHLAAIDVGTKPSGVRVWSLPLRADGRPYSAAWRQLPVVVNAAGARRIVFPGFRSGVYFIGEP